MVAFTDSQLRTVWVAADRVPFEKRGAGCCAAAAAMGFTRADLDDALHIEPRCRATVKKCPHPYRNNGASRKFSITNDYVGEGAAYA